MHADSSSENTAIWPLNRLNIHRITAPITLINAPLTKPSIIPPYTMYPTTIPAIKKLTTEIGTPKTDLSPITAKK